MRTRNEKVDKITSQTDRLSRGRQVINAKQAFMMTSHQLNIASFSPIKLVVQTPNNYDAGKLENLDPLSSR